MPAIPPRQVVLLRSALYRSRTHHGLLSQPRLHILDRSQPARLQPTCCDTPRPVRLPVTRLSSVRGIRRRERLSRWTSGMLKIASSCNFTTRSVALYPCLRAIASAA
jgi:hypothetical protein